MIDFELIIGAVFWVIVLVVVLVKGRSVTKSRPGSGNHPTTINKSSPQPKQRTSPVMKPTVASDGHRIPHSKDITCEGQYGHDHGNMPPRYIVHEEPTEGYCILNGKKVALKDCWKY